MHETKESVQGGLTEAEKRLNVIRLAFGGSEDRFEAFCRAIREEIPGGTRVILRGSAVTGARWRDGSPFDALWNDDNPFERRDGPMAREALRKGVGIASAEFLRGTRLVRAYNCIPAASLANDASRQPERIAIPIAGDDAAALAMAQRLIRDSGFDAVVVGTLLVFGVAWALARLQRRSSA